MNICNVAFFESRKVDSGLDKVCLYSFGTNILFVNVIYIFKSREEKMFSTNAPLIDMLVAISGNKH